MPAGLSFPPPALPRGDHASAREPVLLAHLESGSPGQFEANASSLPDIPFVTGQITQSSQIRQIIS
jgi:hypothetical protein